MQHHKTSYINLHQLTSAYINIHQHTSAYINIHQHTSAYISIHQRTSAYISIHQHTSAYINIHQRTSAYTSTHSHTSYNIYQRLAQNRTTSPNSTQQHPTSARSACIFSLKTHSHLFWFSKLSSCSKASRYHEGSSSPLCSSNSLCNPFARSAGIFA